MLRRLDPGFRFFLEGMDDPQFIADLRCIDDAECIRPVPEDDFKYPASQPCKRFRIVRLPSAAMVSERSASS